MTTVVIPAILVLMMLMGVDVANYNGMTVSDAFESARYNHNYSVSDEDFDNVADKFVNNPDYKNAYITNQDVTRAINADNPYDFLVANGGILWDEINGSFDKSWLPTVDSRVLKVYDGNGDLIGATEIVGITNQPYLYANQVTVQPDLLNRTGYFDAGWLLFRTIDYRGTFYHTDLDFVAPSNGRVSGLAINNFQYKKWYNNTADNVSWQEGTQGGFILELVYDGNGYPTAYEFVSPVLGRNDIEGDTDYIGDAVLSDGSTVGVNPDGSITLPDGTTVRPDSTTGIYPAPVQRVNFPADWWANIARLIGEGATSAPTSNTAAQTDILDSIRDSSAGILNYMKTGFWDKLSSFLSFDYDKVTETVTDKNLSYHDVITECWRQFCVQVGINLNTRKGGDDEK